MLPCVSLFMFMLNKFDAWNILFLGLGSTTSLLLISTLPGIFYLLLNPKGFQVSFHVI